MKTYEFKVAELTFDNEDLRAQVQGLKEQMEKQASDLKGFQAAKDRAEEGEKKARDELMMAREELQLKTDA